MRLIDKYIAKTVFSAMMLVMLMLIGLQIFMLFVGQLGSIGRSDYTVWAALNYVLMDMPYQVYLFFPVAGLMGCLIGLGVLANHHELTVLRASGMSIGDVIIAIFKMAALFILVVTCLGEVFAPKLSRMATDYKLQALSGGQSIRTAYGYWLRSGSNMIRIGQIISENELLDIEVFHFNSHHKMTYVQHIAKARYQNAGWVAYHTVETQITPKKTYASKTKKMPWKVDINPKFLAMSENAPDEMTILELYQYLKEKKLNHQFSQNYELAFWQRLMQPFASLVMMVLAIPFIFGPLRSATLGSKLIVGSTVGFGFHIINRFFGPMSTVYQWSPIFSAVMPTLIFAGIAYFALRRAH